MLKLVMKSVNGQDEMAIETKYLVDRVDRMYLRMKTDVKRHETLCFELADKFEKQHDVICQVIDNIEILKTYALTNDVHLEAFQPL